MIKPFNNFWQQIPQKKNQEAQLYIYYILQSTNRNYWIHKREGDDGVGKIPGLCI